MTYLHDYFPPSLLKRHPPDDTPWPPPPPTTGHPQFPLPAYYYLTQSVLVSNHGYEPFAAPIDPEQAGSAALTSGTRQK